MAGSWEGGPAGYAPGFPKNGKWNVKVEGFKKNALNWQGLPMRSSAFLLECSRNFVSIRISHYFDLAMSESKNP